MADFDIKTATSLLPIIAIQFRAVSTHVERARFQRPPLRMRPNPRIQHFAGHDTQTQVNAQTRKHRNQVK